MTGRSKRQPAQRKSHAHRTRSLLQCLDLITLDAARLLCIDGYGIAPGHFADLIAHVRERGLEDEEPSPFSQSQTSQRLISVLCALR